MSLESIGQDDLESQPTSKPNPEAGSPSAQNPMLGRFMDLELPLAVALGRATIPIHELLRTKPGSLIELNRSAGEYVDLIIHGTVVARGEIVSVKGCYGIRIKELISRKARLNLSDAA
ncbi:MAG: FliM/FliN family flagellar motor switch protein [Acidobacteriota bacterium]|nr:FliM/FliN family flagellar motor switch protein [Acidobacteriota bacterium]